MDGKEKGAGPLPRGRPSTTTVKAFVAIFAGVILGYQLGWSQGTRSRAGVFSEGSRLRLTRGAGGAGAVDVTRIRATCRPERGGGKVVLVTGTGGFVGFHSALALKARGDAVIGLDNFNDYYSVNLKYAREAELEKAGVYTVHADLNDADALAHLLGECHFTHVLHLAAQAGVRYALQNPLSYARSNVDGFVTLLEALRVQEGGPPAIIAASSSSVYGLNTKVPFSETDAVARPASLYAATKRADELLAHTYVNIHNLPITMLRFFTVYGPWGRPDMAYFFFANKIAKGEPITVYSLPDGREPGRDFTYIDDVVQGCLGSIDSSPVPGATLGCEDCEHKRAELRIYNLGNTRPTAVGTMVEILEKHLGMDANKHVVPMPANGDVPFTHANISAAKRDFAYKPTTDLDTGLGKFVEWYREWIMSGRITLGGRQAFEGGSGRR